MPSAKIKAKLHTDSIVMNVGLARIVKSAYRKEPISSFVVTVGAVDAVIGGLGDRWSLFTFGIATVGIAIALRWWLSQRNTPAEVTSEAPQYYLPPTPSRPQLPSLNVSKKHPPR